MSRTLFFLGYIWSLPVTLVALLAAVVGWARPFRIQGGCIQCVAVPRGLWWRFFSGSGMAGSTWGGVMFLESESLADSAEMMRHELRHFAQARILGPLMPLAYGLGSLWAIIRGGSAYFDNPLERDARCAAKISA